MLGESIFFVPVAAGVAVASGAGIPNELMGGAALIGIVAAIAGAIYTTKKKAELEAAKGSAESWKLERDAEVAKAERLGEQLREEAVARRTAEARTDITSVAAQIAANHQDVIQLLTRVVGALEAIGAKPTA